MKSRGNSLAQSGPSASVTSVAWLPVGELTLTAWADFGKRLGTLGRGVGWWIGDWLLYGNERYGEKYSRASRITGYDAQTLMNMVYVASRFAPDRRREQLSWSHHAELAAFELGDQERWLELAIRERISVRSLRLEVRTVRRGTDDRTDPQGDRERRGGSRRVPESKVFCPNCQHAFDWQEGAHLRAGAS
jgi:hypothetical protein